MSHYIIVELDRGFTVVKVPEGETPEMAARDVGGILVDAGPYDSFEKAQDALATLPNPYQVEE
jgi:hypothetical protein